MTTRIFVSSTCYDLKPVREQIKSCLSALGHSPLLSEYSSFPTLPDLTTIENCKRNVQDNTDVFVLIIGGRRGSTDPATNRSIVNSEYEIAKQNSIDIFVFVTREVLTLAHVWEKNPGADFSPTVDSSDVFGFVKQVKEDAKWIHGFDSIVELTEALTAQLSIYLKNLIDRKRSNRLSLLRGFENESIAAQRLVQEKPQLWEHRLTEQLLRDRAAEISRKLADLQDGATFKASHVLDTEEYFPWIQARLSDLMNLTSACTNVFPKFMAAWGPPEQPGDALAIKRVADQLFDLGNHLVEWEASIRFAKPPDGLQNLHSMMNGWAINLINQLRQASDELRRVLELPDLTGNHTITLTVNAPDNMTEFNREIGRLQDILLRHVS